MLVFMIQSALRAVVSANFFVKTLIITNREESKKTFIWAYYSTIIALYALIIVLSLTTKHSINCLSTMFSKYHLFH